MAYPGDDFSNQAIPNNYIKEHPPIPDLISCQRYISKHSDIINIANNNVIIEDFYNKAIEPGTDRSRTHFQGIIRHPSSNVLYLSGSDKINSASQLFVMEASKYFEATDIANHDQLKRGPLGSNVVVGGPDVTKDRLLSIYKFAGSHWHAGGMDTEGEILAIPLENAEEMNSRITFVCIKDPIKPIPFRGIDIERTGEIAGAAALIRLKNGRYLCGVWVDSDSEGHRLDLYLSLSGNLADGFKHNGNYINHIIKWEDKKNWLGAVEARKQRDFQNFQFYRDKKGGIFCFATDNKFLTAPATAGLNRIHLLKLEIDEDSLSGPNPKFVNPRIHQFPEMKINNVRLRYSFAAGASFHITPEKKLALYAVSHWRDSHDRISLGEFYPPLEKTNQTINSLDLARVELYDDANFGINSKGYMMQRCLKIIGGNNNELKDLETIKVQTQKFGDKINSIKFILPKNYSLWLYKNDHYNGLGYEIKGTGKYKEIKDLKKESKVGGRVSSLKIVKNQ